MKKLLITSIFYLFLYVNIFAQCNPNAGVDDAICGLTYAFNATLGDINSTGTWSTNATGVVFSDINDPNANVTVLSYQSIEFYWTEDNTIIPCSDIDTVIITFYENPSSDFTTQSICEGDTAIITYIGNAGSNATYTWTFPGGTIVSGGIGQGPTGVTWTVAGTYAVTLTVTDTNGCSSTGYVDQTVLDWGSPGCCLLPIADAGPDDTVCGSSYDFQAIPSWGLGSWSVGQTPIGGSANIANINAPNSLVAVTQYGSYEFIWIEDNGISCSDTDIVVITFIEIPVANAGPDYQICGLSANLTGSFSSGNTGSWTSSPPAAIFAPHTNPATTVTVPVYGIYTFTWEEDNNGCTSTDDVVVEFLQTPNANAGIDQTVCGLYVNLDATISFLGNTGYWSGPVNFSDIYDPDATANITNIPGTQITHTLYWHETNVVCGGTTDSVEITFEEYININGNVLYNLNPLNTGDAEIELFNINSGNYELNDISSIAGNNMFNLQGNKNGDYILKARVLNHISYPDAMDTYYDGAYLWENAQIFTLSCGDSINVDINLASTIAFTPGGGKVSGIITYEGSGDPVTDAVFFIEDTTVNDPYLYTDVNINGYYQFVGLPQGNFRILVDLPGIPQITIHNFSVTATNTLFENYDFYVDTVLFKETGIGIYADTAAVQSIDDPLINVSLISVYPNPFENKINLEYKLEQNSIVEIQIIDINGKIIQKQFTKSLNQGNYSETIAIAEKGIYFVVVSINKDTYIKKIVSQ